MQILIGIAAAIVISAVAWRAKALDTSGAVAAAGMGGLIFGLGGLPWAGLLLVFFISSSLLSRTSSRAKSAAKRRFAKDSRRDWAQVLANGGLGALLVILYFLFPGLSWIWAAYCAAFAAVNADTWSTELGVLSPVPPRMITSGKAVEPGTSGGISVTGSLAALAGSLLIAIFGVILNPADTTVYPASIFIVLICLVGFLGSTIDSLLGASLQVIYFCPVCQKETERHPRHGCGTGTKILRGVRWLNNDMVNFLSSLAAVIIAVLFTYPASSIWR